MVDDYPQEVTLANIFKAKLTNEETNRWVEMAFDHPICNAWDHANLEFRILEYQLQKDPSNPEILTKFREMFSMYQECKRAIFNLAKEWIAKIMVEREEAEKVKKIKSRQENESKVERGP